MEGESANVEEMGAPKRHRSVGVGGEQVPPGACGGKEQVSLGDLDLISRLPDAMLVTFISLLPTKDGARTQTISRRWRPLWRSSNAPLNLCADSNLSNQNSRVKLVSKILSDHNVPTRRFSLHLAFLPNIFHEVNSWFRSRTLTGLQDLEVTNLDRNHYMLPAHVLTRFGPTLIKLKLGGCQFPVLPTPMIFQHLRQLMLYDINISEDALHSMISSCAILESISLHNMGFFCLCISSPTLRSIGFYAPRSKGVITFQELVIECAPCLERLLPIYPNDGPATIRVIWAPKLKILGLLSKGISTLRLGTTVFQKMVVVSLTTKMHTMKILALDSIDPNIAVIIDFLKCFPCLENLYVTVNTHKDINIPRKHNPLDVVPCLDLHLQKVVLKNYFGENRPFINLANFFILNAKVLREMKIGVLSHNDRMHYLRSKLQVENKASQDAQIELKDSSELIFNHKVHTHDLSIDDPFDSSLSRSSNCV